MLFSDFAPVDCSSGGSSAILVVFDLAPGRGPSADPFLATAPGVSPLLSPRCPVPSSASAPPLLAPPPTARLILSILRLSIPAPSWKPSSLPRTACPAPAPGPWRTCACLEWSAMWNPDKRQMSAPMADRRRSLRRRRRRRRRRAEGGGGGGLFDTAEIGLRRPAGGPLAAGAGAWLFIVSPAKDSPFEPRFPTGSAAHPIGPARPACFRRRSRARASREIFRPSSQILFAAGLLNNIPKIL